MQIAPYTYAGNKEVTAFMRKAQLKASHQIQNTGMVVMLDVGEEDIIHPPDKTTVVKRLVSWALAKTYGFENMAYQSPEYKSMKVEDGSAYFTFDYVHKGLTSYNKPVAGFEIAGADKVFHPATAIITTTGVLVTSPEVKVPVAVRYGFRDWVVGSLFSTEGLPVSSFRTDDW